jgi:hypothetical protein
MCQSQVLLPLLLQLQLLEAAVQSQARSGRCGTPKAQQKRSGCSMGKMRSYQQAGFLFCIWQHPSKHLKKKSCFGSCTADIHVVGALAGMPWWQFGITGQPSSWQDMCFLSP